VIEIELTNAELLHAGIMGVMRRVSSIKRGLKPQYGFNDENPWQIDIEGSCGELAVAKALGIYASLGLDTFKAPDLPGMQIKTRSNHSYELIVRPHDAEDQHYVLVTGKNGKYRVHGWILGKDAKQKKWEQTHGGRDAAYFVPQDVLKPMDDLKPYRLDYA
jgi:hypothetical protein